MVSLQSQQELINTNNWTIDLTEPYVPLSININKLKVFRKPMNHWKVYQLILKDNQ